MNAYQKLKALFKQSTDLRALQRILQWDEAVMMPEGSGKSRAEMMATLTGVIRKAVVSKKTGKLIQAAKAEGGLSGWDKVNLAWMDKDYKIAASLPPKLTEKLSREMMNCEQVWRQMRAENNWKGFLPHFKKLFKLVLESAKRRGDALGLSPYDAQLDEYAPGFNQASIDPIFADLKTTVPQLMKQIQEKQAHESLHEPQGPFELEKQKQLGLKVMKDLGFNFNLGRLDVSHHPFCGGNHDDVRITTRYREEEFFSSLAGICHETGHGLYEQGLPVDWHTQPVGEVNSMALHESMSLLMESLVCSSQPFFRYLLPELRKHFGEQIAFTADNLYKLATRVKPGFIRVDADEVSYQMHIILRYELEKQLINEEISLSELPECWDASMQQYLGLSTKKNYKNGVMQDVHWPAGAFGYFPAYSLGRLIGAQLFSSFLAKHPQFFEELAQGRIQSLLGWLNEQVYCHGSSLSTEEILLKATGRELQSKYFIEHVRARYL